MMTMRSQLATDDSRPRNILRGRTIDRVLDGFVDTEGQLKRCNTIAVEGAALNFMLELQPRQPC